MPVSSLCLLDLSSFLFHSLSVCLYASHIRRTLRADIMYMTYRCLHCKPIQLSPCVRLHYRKGSTDLYRDFVLRRPRGTVTVKYGPICSINTLYTFAGGGYCLVQGNLTLYQNVILKHFNFYTSCLMTLKLCE
jgi:hypothetical protein